jgi:hypothetical protein
MNIKEFRKLYEKVKLDEAANDRVVWLVASDEEIVASEPTNFMRITEEIFERSMKNADLMSPDMELEKTPDAKKFLYSVNTGDSENEVAWILSTPNSKNFLESIGWKTKKTNYR